MTTWPPASFPATRPRRLRRAAWIRRISAETVITPADLVWAVIVHGGDTPRIPVTVMPGIDRLSVSEVAREAVRARALGIPAMAIFPYVEPEKKDSQGREALNLDGLVPTAIRAIKDAAPDIGVICDVALDPFTDHGHDGLIDESGYVLNDETVAVLVSQALVQARAGADVVAPSDMMDGRVGAIRHGLESEGFANTLILSYAAKYASGFYGPYRGAIGSASALKSGKQTYQQDPANSDEAMREAAMDIAEGADMVMVKPGLPCLDILRRLSETAPVPVWAFQVSGEYVMIEAAARQGWLDGPAVMMESLLACKRAGASAIITYYAARAAEIMKQGGSHAA